ncbi:MAG: DMT family transporter [Anaerolineaceae bacterium]|nr:DMT family transporter [Anaerolineaceae bacterium]
MASLSTDVPRQTPVRAYLILATGVAAVTLAAIFIKLAQAQGVPSLFIAAARLAIAAVILTPITLRRHWRDIRGLKRRDLMLALLAGFFLALHFATWIQSFEYTTVLVSVVLVTTSPLWIAIAEITLLRAKLGGLLIIGLVIGITGSMIVAIPPDGIIELGNAPLTGSLLALTGGIMVAAYLLIGRSLRTHLPLLPYIWLVYSCAALILMIFVELSGISIVGYPAESYLWLLALALIPQLIGHTSFNYALRYFSATYTSISIELEPVLSAIIAYFLFSEIPNTLQIIGSGIILVGVTLASLAQARSSN